MSEKKDLVMAVVLENGAVAHLTPEELEQYQKDPDSMKCTMTVEEMMAQRAARLKEFRET